MVGPSPNNLLLVCAAAKCLQSEVTGSGENCRQQNMPLALNSLNYRHPHPQSFAREMVNATSGQTGRPPEGPGSNPILGNYYWTFIVR